MTKKDRVKYQDWVTSYRRTLTNHFRKRCKMRLDWSPSKVDIDLISDFFKGKSPTPPEGLPPYCVTNPEKEALITVRSIQGRKWYFLVFTSPEDHVSRPFWVLFDKKVKNVVTVLPEDVTPNDMGSCWDDLEREFTRSF